MTIVERNNKLKNYIACLKCEVSGKVGKHCDDSCPTQYEAGNMGEIIENLEAISRVLEQEDSDKISYTNGDKILKDYPKATTRICKNKGFTYIEVEKDDKWIGDFSIEWWKSEYKE